MCLYTVWCCLYVLVCCMMLCVCVFIVCAAVCLWTGLVCLYLKGIQGDPGDRGSTGFPGARGPGGQKVTIHYCHKHTVNWAATNQTCSQWGDQRVAKDTGRAAMLWPSMVGGLGVLRCDIFNWLDLISCVLVHLVAYLVACSHSVSLMGPRPFQYLYSQAWISVNIRTITATVWQHRLG